MASRGALTTIGATALGIAVLSGGAPAVQNAFAQEATTPTVQTQEENPTPIDHEQQRIEFEAERAEAYDSFIAALAAELGNDEAAVDAAVRTALKAQVDALQTAGDLDAERAAAAKAVIDVSEAPLFSGFGGRGGMMGPGGPGEHGGFKGHGPRGGGAGERWGDEAPGGAMLPPAQPGDDDQAADQSAPAPIAPATGATIA
jgi:hypothetical protein